MAQAHSMAGKLISWASSLGTTLHPDVEIYEDPVTGLSFRARKEIPPRTNLVNCSYRTTLSYLNAVDTPDFPRHGKAFPEQFLDSLSPEDPNIIGHFFLIQQYLLGGKSFWWPYIQLLPQPDKPSSIPALWPAEDQKYLDGTNADPAIKKRTALWREEWRKAVAPLEGSEDYEQYTYELYKWAASIFGSRSFRPSLTISEGVVLDQGEHVRTDKFSILLPVMDIGNHNGINNVDWIPDASFGLFTLSNRQPVRQNEQIFNYYGNKSNSELLVAYGFTLPSTPLQDRDVVNLKLKPPNDALALRRSQRCHVIPSEREEEFMFSVKKQIDPVDHLIMQSLGSSSPGLIDLVVCMVANKRERIYLLQTPYFCPESDSTILESPVSRAVLTAMQILIAKLSAEQDRIAETVATFCKPQNVNQKTAFEYAKRQLSVLSTVETQLASNLNTALATVSNFSHALNFNCHLAQLFSLRCAFDWLRFNYPDIHESVVGMISEDQEEPLPLNWDVLAEDWDHTYWIVWIFIIWLLWARDGESFRLRHLSLSAWLSYMNSSYDEEITASREEVFFAEPSERDTIDFMVKGITDLPQFSGVDMQKWLQEDACTAVTRVRNFASFIAKEETLLVDYGLRRNDASEGKDGSGKSAEEKALCMAKSRDFGCKERKGAWTKFMSQSLGSRERSNVQN